jgi:hypothetical protein
MKLTLSDPDIEPCPLCRGDYPDDLVRKMKSPSRAI